MAVTAKVYASAAQHLDDDVDWAGDTIKATLHSSTYTPNQGTHEFFSAVTNELGTANGYTAGGVALATKSRTLDTPTRRTRYKAAASVWTATSGNTIGPARYCVIRKDTGSAATSPVLAYVDFGADVSATGAAFTVTWDATDGAFYIEAS